MAFLLSPGVLVQEKDASLIVPSVSSSIGAMVGRFQKGPIEVPTLISSEDQLVEVFGKPNDNNANEWWTIAEFLRYTNACWVVRSRNAGVSNAVSTGVTTVTVLNRDDYESMSSTTRAAAGEFIAKNPGVEGNVIGIIAVDAATWQDFKTWSTNNKELFPRKVALHSYFNSAPDTSPYVATKANDGVQRNDELHILIIDRYGIITGAPYTILEKYEGLSKAEDAVDYQGKSIYYVNVLNENSKYVWWANHPPTTSGANIVAMGSTSFDVAGPGKTFAQLTTYINQTLSGGLTGTPSLETEIKDAYDKLANKDIYTVNLVMTGAFSVGTSGSIEKYVLQNLVGTRKDCIAFISPHVSGAPIRDGVGAAEAISNFKAAVGVDDIIGSYGVMDTGFKYIYDKYSKKYRWVPLNGDIAGLAAKTDRTNDPWWSPAGFNRGRIKNALKLAYNPNQADRDFLYPQGINSVIINRTSGPILLGDRTMTVKPSAFDHINVRRLFIILETAIAKAAKYQLFEFNDAYTRNQFKNMVEPFLKSVKGKRGITNFMVRCDENNNTGAVIDRNEFVAEIYIKPARSINFITLSFVATRTDVAFSTVVGG